MILSFKRFFHLLLILILSSCGNYSFTGASIPEGTETFQVNLFENNSGNNVGSIFEPGLDRDFTIATVAAPTVVKEPEPAAGAEVAPAEEGGEPKAAEAEKAGEDKKENTDKK